MKTREHIQKAPVSKNRGATQLRFLRDPLVQKSKGRAPFLRKNTP